MSGPQTPTPPRATSPIPCKFPIYTVDYTVSHVHKLCKHRRNCQRQHKSDNTALSQSDGRTIFQHLPFLFTDATKLYFLKREKPTVLGDVTLFFSDIFRDGLRRRRNGKQLLFQNRFRKTYNIERTVRQRKITPEVLRIFFTLISVRIFDEKIHKALKNRPFIKKVRNKNSAVVHCGISIICTILPVRQECLQNSWQLFQTVQKS